jgi:hypothetical protein
VSGVATEFFSCECSCDRDFPVASEDTTKKNAQHREIRFVIRASYGLQYELQL